MTGGLRLEAREVGFSYDGSHATITAFSDTLEPGELTAITGPSGSGKSTLLYLLGLMLCPAEGAVYLGADRVDTLSDTHRSILRSELFGFVFQDAMLDPTRTMTDNVTESFLYRGTDRRAAAPDALSLLASLGSTFRGTGCPGRSRAGDFEPLVMIPASLTEPAPVSVVIVVADRPELVASLAHLVSSLLPVDDPRTVTVTSSSELAELRASVESQLSSLTRALTLLLTAASRLVTAALQTALVVLRRKDDGRRRAVGATRSFIITLQLTQTALLTGAGGALGTLVAHGVLLATGAPFPGILFVLAVSVLTLTTALAASLAPAVFASRRDPARELRVA